MAVSRILASTGRVLGEVLKTPEEEIDEYLRILVEMADASGGGLTDLPQTVGNGPDWEDNRILDLAAEAGAFLIASADADLTSMSPWRGRPIIEPPQFASMVEASGGLDGDAIRSCCLLRARLRR